MHFYHIIGRSRWCQSRCSRCCWCQSWFRSCSCSWCQGKSSFNKLKHLILCSKYNNNKNSIFFTTGWKGSWWWSVWPLSQSKTGHILHLLLDQLHLLAYILIMFAPSEIALKLSFFSITKNCPKLFVKPNSFRFFFTNQDN